ncbi:hypothetical protein A2U01_0007989 [Trifolium medium]|uniref:Uncharacterized protein n=1 Tax=Trifolium medium TaxID=97028 RepID=A0A392MLH0_9FABA|nr:hypothetical protein [Trifolium medium]
MGGCEVIAHGCSGYCKMHCSMHQEARIKEFRATKAQLMAAPEQCSNTCRKMAVQVLRLHHCLSHEGASNGDVAGQKSR